MTYYACFGCNDELHYTDAMIVKPKIKVFLHMTKNDHLCKKCLKKAKKDYLIANPSWDFFVPMETNDMISDSVMNLNTLTSLQNKQIKKLMIEISDLKAHIFESFKPELLDPSRRMSFVCNSCRRVILTLVAEEKPPILLIKCPYCSHNHLDNLLNLKQVIET